MTCNRPRALMLVAALLAISLTGCGQQTSSSTSGPASRAGGDALTVTPLTGGPLHNIHSAVRFASLDRDDGGLEARIHARADGACPIRLHRRAVSSGVGHPQGGTGLDGAAPRSARGKMVRGNLHGPRARGPDP